MAKPSRREIIQLTALSATAPSLTAAPAASGIWIDPKLLSLPARPWRKIHLDFHNSAHIPRIGEKFNANEFGDTLLKANVDSVVVFAKDMHGYFYYPSKYGPVHPGLNFDLLGAQVEACRARKIAVYAYHCTTWDNYLAEHHPEWLVFKRDRTTYLPKFDQTPGWTALCIAQEGFVGLMEAHTREFVSRYPIDGAWYDMPYPIAGECFCEECLSQLRGRGLDPMNTEVQRRHKQELERNFLRRLYDTVQAVRPGCQVDFNNQAAFGLKDRAQWMDNIDLEALPSAAQWGYYFFPLVTRYVRTMGVSAYGMTGRFKASWADFGGLKLPAQLDVECASIVANAARCDIGDQMPPSGKLDAAVYHVIGKSYGRIKALEPYLEGAAPVTEAAMLVSGLPIDRLGQSHELGMVKLLTECRVQFDCVEPDAPWERYSLVILPDQLAVNAALAERLVAYASKGGALLVAGTAGLLAGTKDSWLSPYGLTAAGPSPFKPAYLLPKESFTGDIPAYEYALYEGSHQYRAAAPARVVAQLGEPLFQRSPQHFTSHAQTPFDHATEYAAVAVSGRVGLFAYPLGLHYFTQGYWIDRAALKHVLASILPGQLVSSNAPVSSEVTVTFQQKPRPRYLVHIVNWSANRGTPRHPVFHEEPVTLTDITVRLRRPVTGGAARAVVSGLSLPLRRAGGVVEVTVPRVPLHEVLVFEAE
ncbi:MAG: beta-galactosidase trimerization domain-containing protein [Bryobacterales bacterium]|nr:beta-galactosidase trimerization domain-containing protein [Bryobacterales bacterium]